MAVIMLYEVPLLSIVALDFVSNVDATRFSSQFTSILVLNRRVIYISTTKYNYVFHYSFPINSTYPRVSKNIFAFFTFPQTEAFTFTNFVKNGFKMKAYFIAGR